jgi:hypothetical protein
MKRRIMCRSQWNRQPDKSDLFHDTFVDSWDATFFLFFFSFFLALAFAAECPFDYYLYSFRFVYPLGMFIDWFFFFFFFRDWCFVACLRPLPRDIERHQGGVYVWMSCVLCVGTNWRLMNALLGGLLRERKRKRKRRGPAPVRIDSLHLSPIIRPIALQRSIPFERSSR